MTPHQLLSKYYGYKDFRPLQEEIIQSIMEGQDVLGVLPTGGGKSITYQIPGLCLPGIVIVVSPLIALIEDQVASLSKKNIASIMLHSGMTAYDILKAYDDLDTGVYRFLFVSPERLENSLFVERAQNWEVSFLVIDEAHCISEWGHDFRPSYQKIYSFLLLTKRVPILALTASATPQVKKDILHYLQLDNPRCYEQSAYRKNIAIEIINRAAINDTLISKIIQESNESIIVYCNTRIATKQYSDLLSSQGIPNVNYHGGMTHAERMQAQDAWVKNQIRTIVCTNAFGMGIDKPDVRLVLHTYIPESIEAYYQEIGRAGRDTLPSKAILIYDRLLPIEEKVKQKYPLPGVIQSIYQYLCAEVNLSYEDEQITTDFDLAHFCTQYKLHTLITYNTLKILERAEILNLHENVYFGSKLRVKASREDLEFLEIHYPTYYELITGAMRLYEGIMHDLVSIREIKLAQFTQIDLERIRPLLQQIEAMGYITYIPLKTTPQISVTGRLHIHDLPINYDQIAIQREHYRKRLMEMNQLVSNNSECIMQRISNYFSKGEHPRCNQCSTCLRQKIKEEDLVTAFRKRKSIYLSRLHEEFPYIEQEDLIMKIGILIQEGILRMNANGEVSILE
jgi:ATP-dependent DNA helicase RecQ